MSIKTSKKWRTDLRDWLHGAFVAVLTPVAFFIQQSIDAGHLSWNWKGMGMAAIGGLVAYILKKLLTPAQEIKPLPKSEQ